MATSKRKSTLPSVSEAQVRFYTAEVWLKVTAAKGAILQEVLSMEGDRNCATMLSFLLAGP